MPPEGKRAQSPEQRRSDIVRAAMDLFARQGFEQTPVEQIAAGAGVAKGTFYLYFPSKQDLLAAMQAKYMDDFLARLARGLDRQADGDWPGKLAAWVRSGVDYYLDTLPLHDVVFHGVPLLLNANARDNPIIRQLETLLRQGHEAGVWPAADFGLLSVFLFNGLHSGLDAARNFPDHDRLYQSMLRICSRALGLPDQPPA